MTDRPLSLSTPMILALNRGQKTEHRTTLTFRQADGSSALADPESEIVSLNEGVDWQYGRCHQKTGDAIRGPLEIGAAVGDRLWIREDWQTVKEIENKSAAEVVDFYRRKLKASERVNAAPRIPILYPADPRDSSAPSTSTREFGRVRAHRTLPREGSRFTLVVTDIKIDRLQSLSEEEAAAEGVERTTWSGSMAARDYRHDNAWFESSSGDGRHQKMTSHEPAESVLRRSYETLWNSSHKEAPWKANPWVVTRRFSLARSNIDAL